MAQFIKAQDLGVALQLLYSTSNRFVRGQGGRTGPRILKEQQIGVDEWLKRGIWAIVISSNVASIRYHEVETEVSVTPHSPQKVGGTGVLWVMYKSKSGKNRLYLYFDVDQTTAERFFLSPSLGKFTHQQLIRKYVTRQVIY